MRPLQRICFAVICMCCILQVTAQETDPDMQMRKTANQILRVIRTGTAAEFERFIGVELSETGRTAADLQREFIQLKGYLKKFHPSGKFLIRITDEYDSLGRLKVTVPLLPGTDRQAHLSNIRLELLFGPPYQLSLDMIADYHILSDPEKKKVSVHQ